MTGQAVPDEVVSLEVPARHLGAVLSLLCAFQRGMTSDSSAKDELPYRALVEGLLADPAASFELKRRLQLDASRDPVDALRDAEMLRLAAVTRLIACDE
jgi:hypothetical protein